MIPPTSTFRSWREAFYAEYRFVRLLYGARIHVPGPEGEDTHAARIEAVAGRLGWSPRRQATRLP